MKRILVSGATGQIGSALVPALHRRYGPENVIALDHKKVICKDNSATTTHNQSQQKHSADKPQMFALAPQKYTSQSKLKIKLDPKTVTNYILVYENNFEKNIERFLGSPFRCRTVTKGLACKSKINGMENFK